jgi:predicted MPP superfamily phosphohydrolase
MLAASRAQEDLASKSSVAEWAVFHERQRQCSGRAGAHVNEGAASRLEKRLGRLHARQRLDVERDHEGQVLGRGLGFFHIQKSSLVARLIELLLKGTGTYRMGVRNAANVELRHNIVPLAKLPAAFNGFSILHLSDLHCDTSERAMPRVAEMLGRVNYDICVITGDYRGRTFGPFEPCLRGFAALRSTIRGQVYGVLGNHDSIWMLPHLEHMDVAMLMNEAITIERDGARLHLAGIDDAHFYRTHNIEKAAQKIPHDECSILLSHTPEIYRQAAHAGFDLMLSGHTHGGQICLPGGLPLTLASVLPRRLGAGPWRHQEMLGYTSVGAGTALAPVRFNCPPEITLHRLVPDKG